MQNCKVSRAEELALKISQMTEYRETTREYNFDLGAATKLVKSYANEVKEAAARECEKQSDKYMNDSFEASACRGAIDYCAQAIRGIKLH